MKKFLSLSLLVLLSAGIAHSEVTPDEMLDPAYIINSGYSESVAADLVAGQSRANGVPGVNLEDKAYYHKPFIKGVRKVFIYLDPSLDDDYRFHHDIKYTPQISDL